VFSISCKELTGPAYFRFFRSKVRGRGFPWGLA
jgi:hypothetical protein